MGELMKTVGLKHQSLVGRFVAGVVGIQKACPLGVEDYLVASLGWQCFEKTVWIIMMVPILHVVQRVFWRERSVVSYRFFWER